MKDFIDKLELAFDKQLADKTNYGRNQVKELFLRACIEVLADNKASEIPSKEESEIPSVITQEFLTDSNSLLQKGEELTTKPGKEVKRKIHRVSIFAPNHLKEYLFIQYVKVLGDREYFFEIYCNDMKLVCQGGTCIENPSESEILELYNFYKDQPPF